MSASWSVSVVGDDVLFQMLSSGKKLLKAKDFAAALNLFETAKVHCLRNGWGPAPVDEEIARALVGLGRAPEAIALLEAHLHECDLSAFKRLVKIHCNLGKELLAAGDKVAGLAAYNRALSIGHLFCTLSKLRPRGAVWRGGEREVRGRDLIASIVASRGSFYGFTYADDGTPPTNSLICDRDLRILFRLSFPGA